MTKYEEEIVETFKRVAKENGDGASPHEVCDDMAKRGKLAELDTVIDVADQMKALRNRGLL